MKGIGYVVGAYYKDNLPASVFLAPLSIIPWMLISGIFIKIESLPVYIQALTWVCYIRFGIEGLLITLYGYNRCGAGATKKLLEAKVT